jgi:hypothetical protein
MLGVESLSSMWSRKMHLVDRPAVTVGFYAVC